jgi:hypothetical protein
VTLPAPLSHLAAPPVFIVGVARSGTTWLYDIFAAHPEVGGVFESFLFGSTHGLAKIADQPWWHPDFDRYQRGRAGHEAGLRQLITREELRSDLRELTAGWLARAAPADSGRRFVAAKENEIGDLGTIAELYPEARFVHILRDGRDVSLSQRAAAGSWAPEMRLGRTIFPYARQWARDAAQVREVLAGLGSETYEVRYEELRADQLPVQKAVFDFCEIPCDDALGAEIVERTAFERHEKTGDDKFRRQGRSGAWRSGLGRSGAFLFDLAAGGELVELGYERDRRWWLR